MTRDWLEWHEQYDSPGSALARRLDVVQEELRRALTGPPAEPDGSRRLISMCAGAGRDVLPVLADHPAGAAVRALLVELDPTLADRARDTAVRLGLTAVSVRTADAGTLDPYRGSFPAHVLLACGVFGNVPSRTRNEPSPPCQHAGRRGIVIWTRGQFDDGPDPSLHLRSCFLKTGFTEVSFIRPTTHISGSASTGSVPGRRPRSRPDGTGDCSAS